MIEHIVLFDYSNEINQDAKDEYFTILLNSVETLKNIPGVVNISLVNNLSLESDLVFRVIFNNLEELKKFQIHPLHEKHKERTKNIVTNRRVIDFEI